jgi:2-iminobutanoate/2-iminopropanoate deaminase
MMFLAGQCGLDREGNPVGIGDAGAQTSKAIENIGLILQDGGFELTDVVYVTTFLVSLDDFDAYDRAYADAFGSHRPARATVRAELNSPDLLVEIQAIAKKG